MIKKTFFVLIFFTITNCKSTQSKTTDNLDKEDNKIYNEQIDISNQEIYFRATGNEPEWNLKITKNRIEFSSLRQGFEKFITPHSNPVQAMDTTIKVYRLVDDFGVLNIQIQQKNCTNTMSGAIFAYTVKVAIKKNKDLTSTTFNGCGVYSTDYRLHDIWVLETLNGNKVMVSDFRKELPNLEINSTNNTFSGFTGCNNMTGTIFYENDLLRFTDITATKMECEPYNKESEFLKALLSTTTYHIENNRLTLSNPSGIKLVFKKVD